MPEQAPSRPQASRAASRYRPCGGAPWRVWWGELGMEADSSGFHCSLVAARAGGKAGVAAGAGKGRPAAGLTA